MPLDHFLRVFSDAHGVDRPLLSEGAAVQLMAAEWPGNVRQLRNVAERLVLRNVGGVITMADLPREILSLGSETPSEPFVPRPTSEVLFERMVR